MPDTSNSQDARDPDDSDASADGDLSASSEGSPPDDPGQTLPMQSTRLEKLDHFTIEARIGEGGMGIVYQAYDPDLHRSVAIKKIHPRFEGDEEYASRFLTEARAVAAAVHPNIAQIFSIHARDAGAPPYFVMEFVDGESIEAKVQREGPIPVQDGIEIAIQAARGLFAAQQKGIVHRDVKPSNILLTRRQEVKLVDFGLARRTEDLTHLTQAGVILGTPHFVSPEQSQGHHVDHRSDIYSLGCTLYYMFTAREPFLGATKVEVIVAHANEPPPHLDAADFPRTLDATLQRMLAKQPEDRFQNYEELLDELTVIRRQLRGGEVRPLRRTLNWVAVVVVLAALGFGLSKISPPRRSNTAALAPEKYLRGVYHAEGDRDWLEYKFSHNDLDKFFRYSAAGDEKFPPPRLPRVEGNQLSWRNFTRPITFPYLQEFESIEVSAIQFRGSPDFEMIIGYDPNVPENQLRVLLGTDGRPNRHIFECWHGGQRIAVRPGKPSDFTLHDRTSYNLKLTRTSDKTFDFIIEQNAATGTTERERVRFTLPDVSMLQGAIALRGEGLRPQGWGVSLEEVVIGGRLDRPRLGTSF